MLPVELVLITPGEVDTLSATGRLTSVGLAQAFAAGEWLRKYLYPHALYSSSTGDIADRMYVSDLNTAIETAGHLGLSGQWQMSHLLRGCQFGHNPRKCNWFWRPSNGESLSDISVRVNQFLDALEDVRRVIILAHSDWLWAARVRLEYLSLRHFNVLDSASHSYHKIHDGQVLHYTRQTPDGSLSDRYVRKRSVYPYDGRLSSNDWTTIDMKTHTGEELLTLIEANGRNLA